MPHILSVANPPAIDKIHGMDLANFGAITTGLQYKQTKLQNIAQKASDQAMVDNLDNIQDTAYHANFFDPTAGLDDSQRYTIGLLHHLKAKGAKVPVDGSNRARGQYGHKKLNVEGLSTNVAQQSHWQRMGVIKHNNARFDLTRRLLQSGALLRVAQEVGQTTGQYSLSWSETYRMTTKTEVFRTALIHVVEEFKTAEAEIMKVKEDILKARQAYATAIGNILGLACTLAIPFPAGMIVGTGVRVLLSGKNPAEVTMETAGAYFDTGAIGLSDKDSAGDSVISIAGWNEQDPKWLKDHVKASGASFGQIFPDAAKKYGELWNNHVLGGSRLPDIKAGSLTAVFETALEFSMGAIDKIHEEAFNDLKGLEGCAPIVLACWSRFRPSLLMGLYRDMDKQNETYAFSIFEATLTSYVRAYIRRATSNLVASMEGGLNNLQSSHLANIDRTAVRRQAAKMLWACMLSNDKYHRSYAPASDGYPAIKNTTYRIHKLKPDYYKKMGDHGVLVAIKDKGTRRNWIPAINSPVPTEKQWVRNTWNLGNGPKYRLAAWQKTFMEQFAAVKNAPQEDGWVGQGPFLKFLLRPGNTQVLLR